MSAARAQLSGSALFSCGIHRRAADPGKVMPPRKRPPSAPDLAASTPAEPGSAAKPPAEPTAASEDAELAAEVMDFLAAIDAFRRRTGTRDLGPGEILAVLHGLGYANPKVDPKKLEKALAEYRRERARLFPSWSEVLQVARGLGLERAS
jgi:hypothetical protein